MRSSSLKLDTHICGCTFALLLGLGFCVLLSFHKDQFSNAFRATFGVQQSRISHLPGHLLMGTSASVGASSMSMDASSTPCLQNAKIQCKACPVLPARNFSASKHMPAKMCKHPSPSLDAHRYVFVLAGPYSGSSATSGLLMTMSEPGTVSNLCGVKSWQCEGLKIIRKGLGLANNIRTAHLNWSQILEVYEHVWDMSRYLLVEKSPTDVLHVKDILKTMRASKRTALWVIMTRSVCTKGGEGVEEKIQSGKYNGMWLKSLVDADRFLRSKGEEVFHIRYEDLLTRPYAVTQQLVNAEPCLYGIDPGVLPTDLTDKERKRIVKDPDKVYKARCDLFSRFGRNHSWWKEACRHRNRYGDRRLEGSKALSIVEYARKHPLKNRLKKVPVEYAKLLDYFGYYAS